MKIKSLILTAALLSTVSAQAMFRTGIQKLLNIPGKRLVHNNQAKNLEQITQNSEEITSRMKTVIKMVRIAGITTMGFISYGFINLLTELDFRDRLLEEYYKELDKSDYISLQKRLNAPRYIESKVSPADVSLGGLIDQW